MILTTPIIINRLLFPYSPKTNLKPMKSTEYQLNYFIMYVRTKQFVFSQYKDRSENEPVFISMEEIKERFLVNPKFDLELLVERNEIEITKKINSKGYELNFYRILKKGYYDFTLLEPKGEELCSITKDMMCILKNVSLINSSESTDYFDAFLKLKNEMPRIFFTIDKFSGRVHTPISSLKSNIRENILIEEEETTSIDVVTMQPLLLGLILKEEIGKNDFSDWLDNGEDIYSKIEILLNLQNRNQAKETFFQILFSKPNQRLNQIFGNSNWIQWINDFKSHPFEPNPNTFEKNHSNLAYLLQSKEVSMMKEIWEQLVARKIKFLSVHDEIIIKKKELGKAIKIMRTILSKHFAFFKLSKFETNIPAEIQTIEHKEIISHPPTTEELLKLAKKLIGFNNSKQKAEIPFFEEMMEFRILKESKPVLGYYYLSQSTPF
jgi:hypothetical protein